MAKSSGDKGNDGDSGVAFELPFGNTPEEREAAWRAFQALGKLGWRSDDPYGPRDELYDRDDRPDASRDR